MSTRQSAPRRQRRWKEKLSSFFDTPPAHPLEAGLDRINQRLGLHEGQEDTGTHAESAVSVERTENLARSIYYAPDMDGQAEPGEIVWIWVLCDGPSQPPRERAILVIGRTRHTILGLLISPNPDHDSEEEWLEIGSGQWDTSGRQCWLRLDRVLEVSELGIRRQGAVLPRRRFERVAQRLRKDFQWV
ncbi:type II toxin-antitoxin system PemK/MazF family toxin [Corynebacterium uropygiale]|uniref:Type II toxin-antitoxin system PemK/MazF family toxin n=1 Tax=Corynebacterium uropygiale TaxID=1775911 RepID=A0A9X1U021_9CORY|nr:type II toxin-antitoxin system PemK/MazF family toxin [Corynebacterium uropygiale]MCF4007551.1 type II toxin-antitoxin system PemK/MazF family toxin [Corynebacterium uropygiale]